MLARPMPSRSDAVPSRRLEKIDECCLTPPLNDRFVFAVLSDSRSYPGISPQRCFARFVFEGRGKIVSPSDGYSVVKVLLLKTEIVVYICIFL